MNYTKEKIHSILEECLEKMEVLYKEDCVNYRGKTSDTKEYYTEIIADWLLEHLDQFDQIRVTSRTTSYCMKSHEGIPPTKGSNRREEMIAMEIKRQGKVSGLGEIIDYQTPLNNRKCDHLGKIDLLAYDGISLRILELKKENSDETMLRCVLEGASYLRLVDTKKLLLDFGLPENTEIKASPLVFFDGKQRKEMFQERPKLKMLMKALNCAPYYLIKTEDGYEAICD